MGVAASDSGTKIAKAVFLPHPTVCFSQNLSHFDSK